MLIFWKKPLDSEIETLGFLYASFRPNLTRILKSEMSFQFFLGRLLNGCYNYDVISILVYTT